MKREKKYWITQNGDEIEYRKIEDGHLLNILKWIKRRAKEGVYEGVAFWAGDDNFMSGDCWEIFGKEVSEIQLQTGNHLIRNLININN